LPVNNTDPYPKIEGNAYAYASDVAQELRADENAQRGPHSRLAAASVTGINEAFLVSSRDFLFSTNGFQGRGSSSTTAETGTEMCVSQKFLLQWSFLLLMPAPTRVSIPSASPALSGEELIQLV
jgi:hypothetical protein